MFLFVRYITDVCWIQNVKTSKDRRFEMDMRYWIPAGVAFHSQEQEMRTDLVVDETGRPDMTCKEKK